MLAQLYILHLQFYVKDEDRWEKDDKNVKMLAVEAAGCGLNSEKHAASLTGGRPGILHGNKTYLLQSETGQIKEAPV